MPLSVLVGEAEAEGMRSTDPAVQSILGDPLVIRPDRLADRVRARAFGASLDGQLAAGRSPESSRPLAARAQDIVALRRRRSLARDWEHLLRVARRARAVPRSAPSIQAAPIQSDRIAAAGPAIGELVRRLTVPLPVTAQGVAMARVLLTDATSPVYRRHSPVSLIAALDAAIAQLDPALPLMPATRATRLG
jgi:hypothetical protein